MDSKKKQISILYTSLSSSERRKLLKFFRKVNRMNLNKIAKHITIDPSSISRMENGKQEVPYEYFEKSLIFYTDGKLIDLEAFNHAICLCENLIFEIIDHNGCTFSSTHDDFILKSSPHKFHYPIIILIKFIKSSYVKMYDDQFYENLNYLEKIADNFIFGWMKRAFLYFKGLYEMNLQKFELANESLNKATQIAISNKQLEAYLFYLKGQLANRMGDYVNLRKNLTLLEPLAERYLGNLSTLDIRILKANYYRGIYKFENAIAIDKNTLNMIDKLSLDYSDASAILNYNLGRTYRLLKEYKIALHYLKESLKKKNCTDVYYEIVWIHYSLGNSSECRKYIKQCFLLNEQNNYFYELVIYIELNLNKSNSKRSIAKLEQVYKRYCHKVSIRDKEFLLKQIISSYEAIGDFRQALVYSKHLVEIMQTQLISTLSNW